MENYINRTPAEFGKYVELGAGFQAKMDKPDGNILLLILFSKSH
jgi:hypothetical protein